MLRKNIQTPNDSSYAQKLYAHATKTWVDFWFQQSSPMTISVVRVFAACIVVAMGIESLLSMPIWISENGLVDVGISRELIGVGQEWDSLFRPSLLYFLTSKLSIQIYFGALIVFATLMAIGIGSRWSVAVVYVLFLGICHRIPFLIGPAEYLMSALLLYLLIDPGKILRWQRFGFSDSDGRFSAHLVVRLLQVHVWLWMFFALLSQLAAVIWWEGEAVWFLSAQHRSFLSTSVLADNSILVNALTHGLIASQAIALFFLTKRLTRPLGLVFAIIAWIGVGVVSTDIFYAAVGIAGSLSFLELSSRSSTLK
jgi:hypothetical protein